MNRTAVVEISEDAMKWRLLERALREHGEDIIIIKGKMYVVKPASNEDVERLTKAG